MRAGVTLYRLTCSWCSQKFHVCSRDYRGQAHCSDDCRERHRDAIDRTSSALYRHSLGAAGREDHRQEQCAYLARKAAKAQAVSEPGSSKIDGLAEWCSPVTPRSHDVDASMATGGSDPDGDVPSADRALGAVDASAGAP